MTLHSGGVANIHGCFRLIPAVVLLPFTSLFEKIACTIVKDEPVNAEDQNAIAALDALDERFFDTPAIALDQVERVVLEMSDIAIHNFDACVRQMYDYDPKRVQRISEREDLLDNMTDAANKYIVSLSPHVQSDKDNRQQNALLKQAGHRLAGVNFVLQIQFGADRNAHHKIGNLFHFTVGI